MQIKEEGHTDTQHSHPSTYSSKAVYQQVGKQVLDTLSSITHVITRK